MHVFEHKYLRKSRSIHRTRARSVGHRFRA
jgi:hypothetical protein